MIQISKRITIPWIINIMQTIIRLKIIIISTFRCFDTIGCTNNKDIATPINIIVKNHPISLVL